MANIRYDDCDGRIGKLYFAKNDKPLKNFSPRLLLANNKTNVSILTLSLKIL